jgi:hypothetical protein
MSGSPKSYGWAGDTHGERTIEPVYELDFAAQVDGETPPDPMDPAPADFATAGEVMRQVLVYCFDVPRDKKHGGPRLDMAFRRFVGVVWLLRPELLNYVSLMQLSPRLGVTRAALSKMIRNFGDAFGIRNVLQKAEGARQAYSTAQKRDHWRNRAKKGPPASEETGGRHAEHTANKTIHSEASHD